MCYGPDNGDLRIRQALTGATVSELAGCQGHFYFNVISFSLDEFKNGPSTRTMLFRFSLYGFLKNQQYYELFIMLAFLEKGLSFAATGLLVDIREIAKMALEIPSRASADIFGRRHAMIFSLLAHIASREKT